MDDVFKALADASRRELLDRLYAHNGQTLNELCVRLAETGTSMTRQAVSKHLAILEGANLVATVRRGREKLHYLNPVPIHQIAERWIGKFERSRLDALSTVKKQWSDPMSKPSFVYVIYIASTCERVFAALTSAAQSEQYWSGFAVTSDWTVGSAFSLRRDGKVWDTGKVLEHDPPRKLSYSFHPEHSGVENEK